VIYIRIWHTKLIKVLPREQLVGCWRECSAIAGAIQKKGTPNHILVNFVLDYDYDHFISYCFYLREEMTARGYKTMDKVWDKIVAFKPNYAILHQTEIYPVKMDAVYLNICYYNLYEKYLCGGIKQEDWDKIYWEMWHKST
jgi:uncharacterized protein (TIGR02328 family)